MKANESSLNYPSALREMTNYTVREIKKVCAQIGPRPSGEENERKAQEYVAKSMEKVADSVVTEEFSLHPKAFMGWALADVIMMLFSVGFILLRLFDAIPACSLAFNIAACALSGLAVLFMVMEFLFYKRFLDPLFPKRQSCNVLCTRKAGGETKRRIIFSGHIDSSYEWTYTHLGGAKLLKAIIILAFGFIFIMLAADIIAFFDIRLRLRTALIVISFVSLLPISAGAFFVNWRLCVPGANDNLTGVFASMAVLRYMAAHEVRFENTEVVCVSMGCEEAGLRGAKEFAKKHAGEDDIETLFIATDTLRDFDDMGVYNRDMSGTVKLDAQGSALLKQAAKNAGYDLPYANVFFGSSDAAAVMQGGIRSTALAAMDPSPARYYHTRGDTADNLSPKTIEAGIGILLEAAFLFDEKGLGAFDANE